MFGVGTVELLFVALLAGATNPPVGVSPLSDVGVDRVAPEKCLFYFSTAGMAEPNPKSTNHTEQLLANKDVQAFFSELETQITDGLRQAGEKDENLARVLDTGLLPLVKVALTRPAAFYLERLEIHPGGPPEIAAALVLHCGNRTADVRQTIEKIVALATADAGADKIEDVQVSGTSLHRLATDDVQLDWGFQGDYFLMAMGKQASAEVLARINKPGSPPQWLAALKKQAAIERVGTVAYLDGSGLWATIEPVLTDPKVRTLVTSLGLNKLVSVGAVSGFGDEGIVSREFIDFGGWPAGWSQESKLTADDLKPVPDNAEFANIARLDLGWIYRRVIDGIDQVDPTIQIKEKIGQMEEQLGFQVEDDLLAALGDVWTMHSSPGGMLPMSGAVLTLTVRDQQKFAKVHGKLLMLAQALLAQQPDAPFTIETKNVKGLEVNHVQVRAPMAFDPAWAVVDGRLVVAATLQGLKAYIARGGKKSLAELPAIAERLKAGPMSVSYQDTRTAIRQVFTAIQTFGPMLIGQLSAEGINVELPTLPDLEAIEPHILPRIETTRRTPNGIESESFSTVPMASISAGSPATAGILVALLVPAVQQAREAARRNQAMNQLKQINLAMLNHESTFKKFPSAAICDPDGKPLLSWRVKILPYMDEVALYNEFHLDEPWDSEHNKPLLEKMPGIYKNPRLGDLGNKTVYLVPVGDKVMFSESTARNLRSVTDGLSKTILVVEANPESAVPWTKPEDLHVDPKKPAAGLGHKPGNVDLVSAADGSVHVLTADVDAETLWSLFTPAGGEVVIWPND